MNKTLSSIDVSLVQHSGTNILALNSRVRDTGNSDYLVRHLSTEKSCSIVHVVQIKETSSYDFIFSFFNVVQVNGEWVINNPSR